MAPKDSKTKKTYLVYSLDACVEVARVQSSGSPASVCYAVRRELALGSDWKRSEETVFGVPVLAIKSDAGSRAGYFVVDLSDDRAESLLNHLGVSV